MVSVVSDGDWTAATAAGRHGITRRSVRRVADVLVAEGLARYELNPRHKGSPLLRITGEVRAVGRDHIRVAPLEDAHRPLS
jgi:hypothetical protein